jgi:hypothetical protein
VGRGRDVEYEYEHRQHELSLAAAVSRAAGVRGTPPTTRAKPAQ